MKKSRRNGWAVVGGLVLGLTSTPVLAQGSTVVGATTRMESPKNQMLEIKLGSIRPLIGEEDGLSGDPYEDAFGSSGMLLLELEMERYFYQGIGTAGVGFSVGYAEKYGRAQVIDGSGNITGDAAEATGLMVLPLRLHAVYRFDWAALKFNIPFVPYAKAGLAATPWWVSKGGELEQVGEQKAIGTRFGYAGTLGISFLMDFLEPRLARDFDSDLGVNHSYLFAEFTYADVNNFGRDGLNLSTRHWMFGLALEF